MSVTSNHLLVSPQNNKYTYQCLLEHLLSYGPLAKHSHSSTIVWHDDTPGKMNSYTENPRLAKDRSQLNSNKFIDSIGHLHLELYNKDSLLLNDVDVSIKFDWKSQRTVLRSWTSTTYKIAINDFALYVRRVNVYSNILLKHSLHQNPSKNNQVKQIFLQFFADFDA